MGIYIKGVSLDDFKPICPCMNGDYGCCDIPEIKRCYGIGKDGCPLVPVPEHGRLGDLDAATELAMQYCPDDDGSCSKAGADLRELLDEIETLPTIIPAEEGE